MASTEQLLVADHWSCVSSFNDERLKLVTHDQSSWAHEGQCGPSHQDLMVTTLHAGEIDGSVLSPEWTTAKEGLWATLTTMPIGTLTTMPNISPLLYARNSSWSKESAMRAYFTIKLGKQLARIHCICKWFITWPTAVLLLHNTEMCLTIKIAAMKLAQTVSVALTTSA